MPNMLISIASRQLAVLHCYLSATGQSFDNHTNYVYWETVLETDITVVICSWKDRMIMSCASHLISHSKYWWLYSEQRVENVWYIYNGILKSPLFLSLIWCLTSPWLRMSFCRIYETEQWKLQGKSQEIRAALYFVLFSVFWFNYS